MIKLFKRWFKGSNLAVIDHVIYGTGVLIIVYRKWYNPMRWIKGAVYRNSIPYQDFYKD